MSGGLAIEVDDTEVTQLLQKFAAGVGSQPAAMKDVADVLFQFILSPFRTTSNAHDPWGQNWPEWSDATKYGRLHRKKPNYSKQMLVDSRDLVSSIVPTSDATSATVSAGGAGVDDYLLVQQFGTTGAGRGHSVVIPARAFFPMHDEDDTAFPAEWIQAFTPLLQAGIDRYVKDLA